MTSTGGFPPSVILEGPVFRDELQYPPRDIRDMHEIDSLRLVPAKSAANGVYGIYFVPKHRDWALVRLAKRYRWVLELQLNRGLSGEQQMFRQGFTDADLDFLYDIFPAPPDQYNPIVYDILWYVATSDQYLTLTEAMVESETFTPRELIRSTSGIDAADIGYFTRFLRSHLIQPQDAEPTSFSGPKSGARKLTVDPNTTYKLTRVGESALPGIVSEYKRIFEEGDFVPLFTNQNLDPVEHLREFNADSEIDGPKVSLDLLQETDGILGEITRSFTSIDEDRLEEPAVENGQTASSSENPAESRSRSGASYSYTALIQDRPHSPVNQSFSVATTEPSTPQLESLDAEENRSNQEISNNHGTDTQHTQTETNVTASASSTSPDVESDDQYGEFTREEVLQATVDAARMIQSRSVVQTYNVKETVRGAVDLNGRDTGQLWKYVSQALLAMNCVTGRPGGRIWVGLPITPDPIAPSGEGDSDS